ncbi:hypothetical protein BC628DRAFT_1337346 [Trametes gibbosa]|nr:hypothetical protein BC628DRAFT_1337346 [Trametes gibbosa]
MSSSNINDPNAIKALLDHLRSSEAWQKAVNANAAEALQPSAAGIAPAPQEGTSTSGIDPYTTLSNAPQVPHASFQGADDPISQSDGPLLRSQAHSVAALLSQLQGSSTFAAAATVPTALSVPRPPVPTPTHELRPAGTSDFPGPDEAALPNANANTSMGLGPAPARRHDLRACTFQQALPHLARLSVDDGFLEALTAMKTGQAELERQLWKERREIQRKHEERVSTARTRASIIGAGLTPYEAEALSDSFRAELLRFDRERVLPAWDGLLAKQQAALEALGVPAMFPTTQAADRERQQEVMHVLGRIAQTDSSLQNTLQ